MHYAVEDWENDLEWLESIFYRKWMAFKWPSLELY